MKDILKDIIDHTNSIDGLEFIKITNDDDTTVIESITEGNAVILKATAHAKVPDFEGTFGLSNLSLLAFHLKNPEYNNDGAEIKVVTEERNGEDVPVYMHFKNSNSEFENTYRFMNKVHIEEKIKTVKFKGAQWNVEFEPSIESISRMKLQKAANPEEALFNINVKDKDLIMSFGDGSTHAGKFVFEKNVGSLKHTWSWPISHVLTILGMSGTSTMKISDQGAMMIEVDSGLIKYEYILPAQVK